MQNQKETELGISQRQGGQENGGCDNWEAKQQTERKPPMSQLPKNIQAWSNVSPPSVNLLLKKKGKLKAKNQPWWWGCNILS